MRPVRGHEIYIVLCNILHDQLGNSYDVIEPQFRIWKGNAH